MFAVIGSGYFPQCLKALAATGYIQFESNSLIHLAAIGTRDNCVGLSGALTQPEHLAAYLTIRFSSPSGTGQKA
jgi:hypothetical protein